MNYQRRSMQEKYSSSVKRISRLCFLSAFFISVLTTSVDAQGCSDLRGCESCLGGNDCIFALGTCMDGCNQGPDEATCYSLSLFDGVDGTINDVCQFARDDIALCQQQSSCEDCTSAVKSDGQTCQWYPPVNACFGGGTNPNFGSGQLTCESEGTQETPVDIPPPIEETVSPTGAPTDSVPETNAPTSPPQDPVETEPPVKEEDGCAIVADCVSCINDGCFWYNNATGGDGGACSPSECNDVNICGVAECPASPENICAQAGTDCQSCVDSLCSWIPSVESCRISCNDLADAACYSADIFPGMGSTEICATATANDNDSELCFSRTDCGGCTSTPLISDPTQNCQWYQDADTGVEWCQTGGCNSDGICGNDTCRDDGIEEEVVDNGNDEETSAPTETEVLIETADEELCGSKIDCFTCTSTVKSDGITCAWYRDAASGTEWCAVGGCNSNGICGDTSEEICQFDTSENDTSVPVETSDPTPEESTAGATDGNSESEGTSCEALDGVGLNGCQTCLQAGCGWSFDWCVPSCDIIAGALCLEPSKVLNGTTVKDVCMIATTGMNDEDLCGSKNYCFTCTSTVKSDGEPCSWYKDEATSSEWCGVGGCDANGICGDSYEEICQLDESTNGNEGASPGDSETINSQSSSTSSAVSRAPLKFLVVATSTIAVVFALGI